MAFEENECCCDKTLKPTNSKAKKLQPGFVRNGVYNPNASHSVLVTLLQTSNNLYGYNSNFSQKFNFTLCAKCNSQLTRDQNTYNKNENISTKREKKTKASSKPSEPNNLDTSFHFKLVIKTPDVTKPAKAITWRESQKITMNLMI